MDWWGCAPSLVPPSLQTEEPWVMLSGLNIVKYRPRELATTKGGFRSRSSRMEKEKEKERPVSSQSPAHSSPLLLRGAASGASADSSRSRTAQAATSGLQRDAHSSSSRDAFKKNARSCNSFYLIGIAARQIHKCARMCVRVCVCALLCVVAPPRDSWTWILQRISAETFRKFNGFLCKPD